MRRVLLAEELELLLEDLVRAMGTHFQVFTCATGPELLQTLEHVMPDLMVLDLSMSGYDPFHVLKTIQNRNIPVIATCFGCNDYLIQLLDNLGVRWLITKPLQSATVAARLLELELELDDPPDRAVRSAAYTLLLKAGITLRQQSFDLLSEALVYAAMHNGCSMVDELYPHVAQKFNTTSGAADIAMRRCIERAYKFKNPYNWGCLFDRTATAVCPSNSAFIKQLAHIIQNQLQNLISI